MSKPCKSAPTATADCVAIHRSAIRTSSDRSRFESAGRPLSNEQLHARTWAGGAQHGFFAATAAAQQQVSCSISERSSPIPQDAAAGTTPNSIEPASSITSVVCVPTDRIRMTTYRNKI